MPNTDDQDQRRTDRALSSHILPASGTMVGICVTLIGLVKVVEGRIGPSRVDEYAALVSLLFLASAIASYVALRLANRGGSGALFELVADICFLIGLVAITAVALFFAYEAI